MKQSDPFIDVRIPFEPGKQLGFAYNRAMQTVSDWVLFLDHDVLLVNPDWYAICQKTITRVGHKAGFITCVTNRISNSHQQAGSCPNDDIKKHIGTAKSLYEVYKDRLHEMTIKDSPFSGFFILTHKQAWKDAGGFKDGFLGVDNAYYHDIIKANYNVYIMPELYVYHIYRRKTGL